MFNLEKEAVQGIIKKLEIENKGISDPNEINKEINSFQIVICKDFAKVIISIYELLWEYYASLFNPTTKLRLQKFI